MRRLDDERLSWLEETSRDYEMALMEAEAALTYLRGRGLSTSSVDRFRLGLVADPPAEHRSVEGRLVIPTIKKVGVTGFKFRCIRPECLGAGEDDEHHEGHGKYQTYEPQSLFNVAALDTDRGYIALCEGELDAMTLTGECDIPALGLVGVNSWHPHYERMLRDFSRIWVFADQDVKAAKVGQKFGSFLVETFPQALLVELPAVEEGKKSDLNRVFRARGRDYVRSLVGL